MSESNEPYAGWQPIVRHYEARLQEHGATPEGADWPNGRDLATRFAVMLELVEAGGPQPEVLDLGCGPGLLLDYLAATGRADSLRYRGIDISPRMVELARARWPAHDFECRDILRQPLADQSVDVVLMNGVLTERLSVSVEAMQEMAHSLIAAAFKVARFGIVFNLMSAHVDWQRDDLFHVPFDELAAFLKWEVSRHFSFRADYGLYEYTCFVMREPRVAPQPADAAWWERPV